MTPCKEGAQHGALSRGLLGLDALLHSMEAPEMSVSSPNEAVVQFAQVSGEHTVTNEAFKVLL